jgi:hypothetical protein
MKKIALIGIGKMGISHLSILGAHPQVEIVGVVDTSTLVTDIINKYTSFKCFENYKTMLNEVTPDAVVVSVPTKYHEPIVREMINKGIHVFVEKPFCLGTEKGYQLVELAKNKNVINQVGYHNKFIGTFVEANKINEAKVHFKRLERCSFGEYFCHKIFKGLLMSCWIDPSVLPPSTIIKSNSSPNSISKFSTVLINLSPSFKQGIIIAEFDKISGLNIIFSI